MQERTLLLNRIRCPDGTVLTSRSRHDFKEHTQADGRYYFVDGGLSYQRIGYSDKEYTDLSIYTNDTHIKIRENMEWGKNYDKEMNLLPKTVYVKVKDITDGHLKAIMLLTKGVEGSSITAVHQVFQNELEFREI